MGVTQALLYIVKVRDCGSPDSRGCFADRGRDRGLAGGDVFVLTYLEPRRRCGHSNPRHLRQVRPPPPLLLIFLLSKVVDSNIRTERDCAPVSQAMRFWYFKTNLMTNYLTIL
jgi:hypothetical protein